MANGCGDGVVREGERHTAEFWPNNRQVHWRPRFVAQFMNKVRIGQDRMKAI